MYQYIYILYNQQHGKKKKNIIQRKKQNTSKHNKQLRLELLPGYTKKKHQHHMASSNPYKSTIYKISTTVYCWDSGDIHMVSSLGLLHLFII